MATGTVKWFSNQKGYGFIIPDEGEMDDIFVHFSAIEMEGYRTLKPGQKVEYDTTPGPKGLHACNLKKMMMDGTDIQAGDGASDSSSAASLEMGDVQAD